jgi:hypothetical protein
MSENAHVAKIKEAVRHLFFDERLLGYDYWAEEANGNVDALAAQLAAAQDLYTRYLDWRDGQLIPNEHELLAMFDRETAERRMAGQSDTDARHGAMLAAASWLRACLTPYPDEDDTEEARDE